MSDVGNERDRDCNHVEVWDTWLTGGCSLGAPARRCYARRRRQDRADRLNIRLRRRSTVSQTEKQCTTWYCSSVAPPGGVYQTTASFPPTGAYPQKPGSCRCVFIAHPASETAFCAAATDL
ncbi:hypothetical protein C0Q70_10845 [Pomacea canaliculata]|uniref:Uncharacterized protein n=1 Tax=Pomacea canaliculata TaxID=400727 RepID=A0A2T7P4C4_POMCA|nr:hypothetical protein C0Q70_10845 [Pomacea canaliculata]